jgi:hypothetical protein
LAAVFDSSDQLAEALWVGLFMVVERVGMIDRPSQYQPKQMLKMGW